MSGASPYDDETEGVLERTRAKGVVLVVIGGKKGNAYSVVGPAELHYNLPELLRRAADEAEAYQRADEFTSQFATQTREPFPKN